MNLPAGVSPDCADVAFLPGAVMSRPGLTKFLATALGSVAVTYCQSFVANDGTIYNFFLDSAGNLWIQNVTSSPGTVTNLGTVTPGSYAKGVTAFGRQWFAFSDGIHGTDVPLKWDPQFGISRVTQDGPGTPPTITNVIIPSVALAGSGSTLTRASNIVTARTASAHGLLPGYMFQLSGVLAEPLGFITSIVIDNQGNPGIATVTLSTAHNFAAGMFVSIQDVVPSVIGGTITGMTRVGGVVTFSTSAAINISAGAIVLIAGNDPSVNTTFVVAQVTSPDSFICYQVDADIASSVPGGTVSLIFPHQQAPPNNLFEIVGVPSGSSFQIELAYSSGTWTGSGSSGPAAFTPWDGTFFVKTVPTTTSFTYQQYGVDDATTNTGMVAPQGQASAGTHQMRVSFLLNDGYLTRPSPPLQFQANGTQYLQVSNLPIGPPNTVARVIEFTGAEGAYFFYIPVAAQVNGQIVSTATQVNDNTTTTVVLDFSDNTLFSSIGTSTTGNDTAQQVVLDSALGFALYGSRLITYGQRNAIQNLLNMGFDGGSISSQITGWTGTGSLVTGHFSIGVSNPSLTQSFYQDAYGAPIATPNTPYLARAWVTASTTVTISSVLASFTSTATLTPGVGGWAQAAFSNPMPATIPSDMILTLTSTGVVDDLSIIYAEEPFINTEFYGSYVNNPEAFDGVTGVFGVEDVRKIMTCGIIRNTLFALTQDPAGRLHAIENNGVTEPAGWSTQEIAGDCGAMSTFCLTVSQADDASAAGGEEWMAWMSYSAARIFSGNQPWRISKEIQPNWDNINSGAWLTTWALNDPAEQRIYFGLPYGYLADGVTVATAPNKVYHVDYKNLDTAEQIAEAAPIHLTFTGKLIARDHARKWSPWNFPANGAALIYIYPGAPLIAVFFAGNGGFPGTISGGCGNVFYLSYCGTDYVDACYGTFLPYYTTYAFSVPDQEQAFQLGGQRKLLQYLQWNMAGAGQCTVQILPDTISNVWPIQAKLPVRADPTYDDEWGGGQASGQRFFVKFTPSAT